MTVIVNEMDMVPGEPEPEPAPTTEPPPPSPAKVSEMVERVSRTRRARDERIRAY
jgi:hypothetical protein